MKKFILDEIDHQILDILIENARTPFTDIAKQLLVSAGTIHVRVKKMEDEGIIQGSTLTLNYEKMGYSFIAHVGVYLEKTSMTQSVIENLRRIPNVTVAYVTAGKYMRVRIIHTWLLISKISDCGPRSGNRERWSKTVARL